MDRKQKVQISNGRMTKIQVCLAICVVAAIYWFMMGIFVELKPEQTTEEQVQNGQSQEERVLSKHPADATWDQIMGKPTQQPQEPLPEVPTEEEFLAPTPTSIMQQVEEVTSDFATMQNENPIRIDPFDLEADDEIVNSMNLDLYSKKLPTTDLSSFPADTGNPSDATSQETEETVLMETTDLSSFSADAGNPSDATSQETEEIVPMVEEGAFGSTPENTTNSPIEQAQPDQVASQVQQNEDLEMTRIVMKKYNPEQQRAEELVAAHGIKNLAQLFKLLEARTIDASQFHDIYKFTDLVTGVVLAGVEDDEGTRRQKEEEKKVEPSTAPVTKNHEEKVELSQQEKAEIKQHQNAMMNYLEKRNATFPSLKNSIGDFQPGEIDKVFSIMLESDPHPLPKDQLSWAPNIFGYTNEQAADVYKDKTFGQCNADWPDDVGYFDEDNKLVVNWTENTKYMDYIMGTQPKEERLGNVQFKNKYTRYSEPVQFDHQEFAFSRCDRKYKYGTLRNIRLEEASNRASETAKNITEEVKTKEFRPISIYLMITDSVSRNHFYRNFPKTVEWLNDNVVQGEYSSDTVMYDFIINNVHGMNSIPNVAPLVFGYNDTNHYIRTKEAGFKFDRADQEFKYVAIQKESLWGVAKQLGFVTSFGFDTLWDYISQITSRVLDTDHLLSNFYHGAKKAWQYNEWSDKQHCIGKHNSFWYMLDYVRQFHNNYKGNNRFVYMHNSAGHEDSGTIIKTLDEDMQKFIEDMAKYIRDNPQEDVVVMLSADHGKQPVDFTHSHEGFIENKLPFHLMFANKSLIARLNAHDNLLHNTKRLISRYDWYMTMRHLMTAPYGFVSPESEYYEAIRNFTDSSNTISLLSEKVPDDRTCEDMVIPNHVCSCKEWVSMTPRQALDMQAIKDMFFLAENAINKGIKNKETCQAVTFSEIVQADYQVFKNPNSGVRNLKIYVSIEQNPVVRFEVHGFMASKGEMQKQKHTNSDDLPMGETRWWEDNGKEKKDMRIKVLQIVRVDRYAGICEEMARQTGEKASTCIWRVPKVGDVPSEKQLQTFSELVRGRTIQVGKPGMNCNEAWAEKDYHWVWWLFPALKNLEVAEWISHRDFTEEGETFDHNLDTCDQAGGNEEEELKPVCPCE